MIFRSVGDIFRIASPCFVMNKTSKISPSDNLSLINGFCFMIPSFNSSLFDTLSPTLINDIFGSILLGILAFKFNSFTFLSSTSFANNLSLSESKDITIPPFFVVPVDFTPIPIFPGCKTFMISFFFSLNSSLLSLSLPEISVSSISK